MREIEPAQREQLAARLRRETSGEVMFGARRSRPLCDRCQHLPGEPVGVVVPRTHRGRRGDDRDRARRAAFRCCRAAAAPASAARRSTAPSSSTARNICAACCRSTPARHRARVEPGIVLGHLNTALQPHGLFFPVDPSTHARCTLGGMAGNNSCGVEINPLRADGRQRVVHRRDPRRRHAAPFRRRGRTRRDAPRIAELIARLRALGPARRRRSRPASRRCCAGSAATTSTR